MTLKSQLTEGMKIAMRNKDTVSLSTIRLVNAAIKQYEIDEQSEADDAKVIAIITKMVKQRKDSAKIYAEAQRADLADKENSEIDVLNRYLPKALSTEEILLEIDAAVAQTKAKGMSDMGKVMAVLKNKLAGKADMSNVSQLLKSKLNA